MDIFERCFPSSSSFILLIVISNFLCIDASKFSTVIIKRNGRRICSGSYKTPDTIVTAARCVMEGDVEEYKIVFQDKSKDPVDVQSIYTHAQKKGKDHDIAMLYLSKNVTRNGKIKEVKGRFSTSIYDLKLQHYRIHHCAILDPITLKRLRHQNYRHNKINQLESMQFFAPAAISVRLLSNSKCQKYTIGKPKKEHLCVIRKNENKCPAGQGNPVVCTLNDGAYVQVGIHLDNSGCSKSVMLVTRLSKYRAWLRNPSKYNAVTRQRKTKSENGTSSSGNGTIEGGGNLINNGSINGTIIDGGNGTIIDGGNGTVIDGRNGTIIDGGNGTIIDGGNGTITIIENGNGTTNGGTNETTNGNFNGTTTVPPPISLKRICTDSEFRCSDGTCIPDIAVCDGNNDCPCGLEDESACGCELFGTEFITGFLHNVGPEVSILYIMAPELANVRVTIPFLSYNESKIIQGAYKWSFFDTTLVMAEKNSRKGVHIVSDTPITVIAMNSRELSYTTVDGTIVYPVNCLSTEYLVEVQSHRSHKTSQYAIIGTQNTTTNVTIANKRGRVFHIQLGYLDSYFLQEKDLRGTSISSTGNVVVISGSECGYVPSGMTASCDHLVNQVPPRSSLGYAYIVAQQKPRKGFSYRVKATQDNTVVIVRNVNGELVANVTLDILTEHSKMELDSQPLSITSDRRIMVTQYALDAVIDDLGQGDPSMVILPALNSFDSNYKFVIPDFFLRVGLTIYISACHDPNGLLLDGKNISNSYTTLVTIPGYGDYNVINVDLESKWSTPSSSSLSHLERDVTFGAIMYGTRVEGAFAWRIGGKL